MGSPLGAEMEGRKMGLDSEWRGAVRQRGRYVSAPIWPHICQAERREQARGGVGSEAHRYKQDHRTSEMKVPSSGGLLLTGTAPQYHQAALHFFNWEGLQYCASSIVPPESARVSRALCVALRVLLLQAVSWPPGAALAGVASCRRQPFHGCCVPRWLPCPSGLWELSWAVWLWKVGK